MLKETECLTGIVHQIGVETITKGVEGQIGDCCYEATAAYVFEYLLREYISFITKDENKIIRQKFFNNFSIDDIAKATTLDEDEIRIAIDILELEGYIFLNKSNEKYKIPQYKINIEQLQGQELKAYMKGLL